MPEMHLRQPRFTYSVCGKNNNKEIKKQRNNTKN